MNGIKGHLLESDFLFPNMETPEAAQCSLDKVQWRTDESAGQQGTS